MASSSPGRGHVSRPGGPQSFLVFKDLTREERLFMGTQVEILDWTKLQPREDASKAQKRRVRIKALMKKATLAFCSRMSVLTNLRNRRDRVSSNIFKF